jgi:hypothetical protein
MKLAHLRDSYYKARYGTLSADDAPPDNVVTIESAPSKRRAKT